MTEEERFFAWLDGELPADEAEAVEREVAADPALRELARQHRAMADDLQRAFAPVLHAPVPETLKPGASEASDVVSLKPRRAEDPRRFWKALPQWAAIAATLVLGIGLGSLLDRSGSPGPAQVEDGRLLASGAVAQALDTQLASAGTQGDVRIGLTFRDEAGAVCRSFETAAAAGLACRDGGAWHLRGLFAAPEGSATDYRMAAGANPQLMELVDTEMRGEAFDASQEAAAKRDGWR